MIEFKCRRLEIREKIDKGLNEALDNANEPTRVQRFLDEISGVRREIKKRNDLIEVRVVVEDRFIDLSMFEHDLITLYDAMEYNSLVSFTQADKSKLQFSASKITMIVILSE